MKDSQKGLFLLSLVQNTLSSRGANTCALGQTFYMHNSNCEQSWAIIFKTSAITLSIPVAFPFSNISIVNCLWISFKDWNLVDVYRRSHILSNRVIGERASTVFAWWLDLLYDFLERHKAYEGPFCTWLMSSHNSRQYQILLSCMGFTNSFLGSLYLREHTAALGLIQISNIDALTPKYGPSSNTPDSCQSMSIFAALPHHTHTLHLLKWHPQ